MTKEHQELYNQTVKRLARGGIKDPTAQIIALAEEIECYRAKIRGMEEEQQQNDEQTKAPRAPIMPFPKPRLTQYDQDLERFVVPLFFRADGSSITFSVKSGRTYMAQSSAGKVYAGKEPDVVFGEIIDRLAELENREEEQSHAT